MLRFYFLQQWYGLSDEGLEDALYDSIALRAFAGIDLTVENVPDATTRSATFVGLSFHGPQDNAQCTRKAALSNWSPSLTPYGSKYLLVRGMRRIAVGLLL